MFQTRHPGFFLNYPSRRQQPAALAPYYRPDVPASECRSSLALYGFDLEIHAIQLTGFLSVVYAQRRFVQNRYNDPKISLQVF
jgi:hypothetical protein